MLANKSPPIGKFISSSGEYKFKILRPITLNNYQSGKVGLGIVAALENSGEAKTGFYSRNLIRSNPIPVTGGNNSGGEIEEMEDRLEEYTYVTCHGPEESYTRVYCDGGRFERRSGDKKRVCVFDISPARFGEVTASPATSDFLSFCHLCRKNLHGEDIYMYRGEKAFCSRECRQSQISMDKSKEKCSNISRSPHISSSPSNTNNNAQIFSPGIPAIQV